jgi:hypothetical protein
MKTQPASDLRITQPRSAHLPNTILLALRQPFPPQLHRRTSSLDQP